MRKNKVSHMNIGLEEYTSHIRKIYKVGFQCATVYEVIISIIGWKQFKTRSEHIQANFFYISLKKDDEKVFIAYSRDDWNSSDFEVQFVLNCLARAIHICNPQRLWDPNYHNQDIGRPEEGKTS